VRDTIEKPFFTFSSIFDRIDDSPSGNNKQIESPTPFHVNDLLTPNVGDFVLTILLFRSRLSAGAQRDETQTVRDFFKRNRNKLKNRR
jgi:hypothetical protein